VQRYTLSFAFILASGVLLLAQGLFLLVMRMITALPGLYHIALLHIATAVITLVGVVSIVLGVLMLIGAALVHSSEKGKALAGSIIAIVVSVLSMFFGGGFIIGFVLGLVGGVLGLVEV